MANVLIKLRERKLQGQLERINDHPLAQMIPETKEHYVNGLALLAGCDGNLNVDEEDYLRLFKKILKLDDDHYRDFLKKAEEQDEETFDEFINAINKEKKLKLNFMVDALSLAFCDGNLAEEETEFIDYLYENLTISEEQKTVIKEVLYIIGKKDKNWLVSYFIACKDLDIKEYSDQFEYLFVHNHLDVVEIIDDIYNFEWTEWELDQGSLAGGRFVTTKPVTFQQYLIYLNYLVITGEIKNPDQEWEDASDTYEYSDNRVITHKVKEDPVDKFKGGRAVDFAEWLSNNILKDIIVNVVRIDFEDEDYCNFSKTNKCKPLNREMFLFVKNGYYHYSFYKGGNDYTDRIRNYHNNKPLNHSWVDLPFRLMKIEGKSKEK